jgi:hypothetical protein
MGAEHSSFEQASINSPRTPIAVIDSKFVLSQPVLLLIKHHFTLGGSEM